MSAAHKALPRLQARLEALRKGQALSAYARVIGVAPKLLLELLKGDPPPPMATPKALAGRAESIGRIVDFANQDITGAAIDPSDVLKDLGLDASAPSVVAGLSRRQNLVRVRQEYVTHGDPVIERIVFGEGSRREPRVVLSGVVAPQHPFCPGKDEIDRSFSGKFLRRLLGCLQPTDWTVAPVRPMSFAELFEIDQLRSGELDVAFGLFDTPSRRLDGFDFIHVPGIGAPLICYSFGVPDLHWAEFLDADARPPNEYNIVVISGEVGDILVRGSCDYPDDRIEALESNISTDEIVKRLAPRAMALADRDNGTRMKPFVFCAGMAAADQFRIALNDYLLGNGVSAKDVGSIYQHCVGSDERLPLYPIYKVSMAVSSLATRWRNTLQDAVVSELFVNSRAITAKQYVDLFLQDSSVEMIPLMSDLPLDTASLFLQAFKWEIERRLAALALTRDGKSAAVLAHIQEQEKRLTKLSAKADSKWCSPLMFSPAPDPSSASAPEKP